MKWNRTKVGLLSLVLCFLLNQMFIWFPAFYDKFYFRGVFQVMRFLYDHTFGFMPFPSIYIVVPAFFGYFFWKQKRLKFWPIRALLNSLIWIVVLFYIVWGFNYTQPSLYGQLEMDPVTVDSTYITNAFKKQTIIVEQLLVNDMMSDTLDQGLEKKIRKGQEKLLRSWGMPTVGRVRIRHVPGGGLLHFRTSGMYIPHAFEGHVDNGLYHRQHPFTMAHEMAHGYGFTDESVCNFIAYVTCLKSKDPSTYYSGQLAYWRYLARYYKRFHHATWSVEYENFSPALKSELLEIRNHIGKYKDWMPKYRDVIYDQYLKTHGVSAGIQSYDQMILLIAAYDASALSR